MGLIKILPASVEYLWGGRRLLDEFGKTTAGDTLGESWELSCHPDGESRVATGGWAGLTLREFLEEQTGALGTNCDRFGGHLPILIKLIDAAQPLSIQVHPSDSYAWEHEGQAGKTEVWYIVDCAPDAFIYYGVDREVTQAEFEKAMEDSSILELLRKVPVKKGETYFIESGTIHAIGAGIVIAEIQQNSNVTYRLYDFDRRDASGSLRTLHRAQAAAVSRLTPNPEEYDFEGHLALCDYFCVDKLTLDAAFADWAREDSFVSLLVLEGEGTVECGGLTLPCRKGESLLLTAGSGRYVITGTGVLLRTTVPQGPKLRLGVDLGGTNIKVGLVGENHQLLAKKSVKTLVERPWKEVVRDMAQAVLALLAEQGLTVGDCASLGIGSPGTVDATEGIVLYSNNFNWENIPLVAELKKYIALPMAISNDANCAALGEVVCGAAKGCKNAILLTLGTGVGGGVILDGKIFEGGAPGGAELGHTTLIAGGAPCTCGRLGCLEAYASATALIGQARAAAAAHPESLMNKLCGGDPAKIDGKTPFDAAQQGDATAQRVVEAYLTYLGEGITNLVNIFRPEKIILSGGVCAQGEAITHPLEQFVQRYSFAGEKAMVPPVVIAALGNDAGILGAANLM